MGANKTNKAVERSSRAAGGERKIVENFDHKVNKAVNSSSHTYRSSALDEGKILVDLLAVQPFAYRPNRRFDSFCDIIADPLQSLD